MASSKNTFQETSEEAQGDHLPKASPLWPINVSDLFLTYTVSYICLNAKEAHFPLPNHTMWK